MAKKTVKRTKRAAAKRKAKPKPDLAQTALSVVERAIGGKLKRRNRSSG